MTRLVSGALVVAVAGGGGLLSADVAHAQPPPNLGTLTFTPATGADTSAIVARTSGGCTPAESDAFEVRVTGPNNFNFLIVGGNQAGFSQTDPFNAVFGQTMRDAGALQEPPVPIVTGSYAVTLNCRQAFPPATFDTYTGTLFFTSPTEYRTTAPPTPSPSPSPGPSVTATTTNLTVFPSPAFQGLPMFLFAQVALNSAAGTVQFKDGNTNLGGPVQVNNGFAFRITFGLTVGQHTIRAEFAPANPARFGPSSDSEQLTVRRFVG